MLSEELGLEEAGVVEVDVVPLLLLLLLVQLCAVESSLREAVLGGWHLVSLRRSKDRATRRAAVPPQPQ